MVVLVVRVIFKHLSESLHFPNMISSSPQLELHYSHIKEQYKINSKLHIITGEEFLKYTSQNPFGRKPLQKLYSSRMDFLMNYFMNFSQH